jgi:hypothetical protein
MSRIGKEEGRNRKRCLVLEKYTPVFEKYGLGSLNQQVHDVTKNIYLGG